MQPSSDQPSSGANSSLRRWGPIAGIVVVLAVIVGVIVLSGGDDDDSSTATGNGNTATTAAAATGNDGDVTYPMSFRKAAEAGLDGLEWGDRCDTETGQVKIPSYYAAECYLPFEGDNGGATADGVTADSIKIVVYQGPDEDPIINYITDAIQVEDTNADAQDTRNKWVTMLQTYEESYGRTIDLQHYVSEGGATDAVIARADAVKIAAMKPFQVWGGPALTTAFGEELNANGIQCYGCGGGTQEEENDRAPLYFGGLLNPQQFRQHNIEALVKQVAGHPAEYAGDPELQKQDRKFGYLYIETSDEAAGNAEEYKQLLADRGVDLAEMVPYTLDPATLQETAANAISKLKSAGVTTIIFAGDPIAPRDFTNEATAQDYFPEWFLNLSVLIDTNVFSRTYDQQQWQHAFGLSALAARVNPHEFGGGAEPIYLWFFGEEPKAIDTINVVVPSADWFVNMLQGVGPTLTHETFRDAVFAYEPLHRGLTQSYSTWGDHGLWPDIPGDDYSGIDDVTKVWWDPEAEGEDEIRNPGKGLWHFVDGGKRYLVSEWEEGDFGAFVDEGSSTIYDTTPDAEPIGDYEPLKPSN